MTFNDYESVTLRWALEGEGDREVEEGALVAGGDKGRSEPEAIKLRTGGTKQTEVPR